ncbi:unnamed protein product [Ixodes hexagonus]
MAESAVPSSTGVPSEHERDSQRTSGTAKHDDTDSKRVSPGVSYSQAHGSTKSVRDESTVPGATEHEKQVEPPPYQGNGGVADHDKVGADQSTDKKEHTESQLDSSHVPLKTTVLADSSFSRTHDAKGVTKEDNVQSSTANVQPAQRSGESKQPTLQDTRPKSSIPPPPVYDKPSRSATVDRKLPEEIVGTDFKTNGLHSNGERTEPVLEPAIETSEQVEVVELVRPQQACYTGTTETALPKGVSKGNISEPPTALGLPSDVIDEEAIRAQLYALSPESAEAPLEHGQPKIPTGTTDSDRRESASKELAKDALQSLPKSEEATSELDRKPPSSDNDNEEAQERRLSMSKLDKLQEDKGRPEGTKSDGVDSSAEEKADRPERIKEESESPPAEHREADQKDNKSEEVKSSLEETTSDQEKTSKKDEEYGREKGVEEKDEKDEKYAKEIDVKESCKNGEQEHRDTDKEEERVDGSKDVPSLQPDKNGRADASASSKEVESREEKETAQDVFKDDKSSKDVREEAALAGDSRTAAVNEETQGTGRSHYADSETKGGEAKEEQEETQTAKDAAGALEEDDIVDTAEQKQQVSSQDKATIGDPASERKTETIVGTTDSVGAKADAEANEEERTAETVTEKETELKVSDVAEEKEEHDEHKTKGEGEIVSETKADDETKPEPEPSEEDSNAGTQKAGDKATEPSTDELAKGAQTTTEEFGGEKQEATEAPDEGQEAAVSAEEQAAEARDPASTEAVPEPELSAETTETAVKADTIEGAAQETVSKEQQDAEPTTEEAPSEVEAAPPPQVKKRTSLPKSPSKRATGKVPPRSLDKKEPPATSDAKTKAPGSPKKPTSIPDKGSPSPKKSAAPPKNEVTSPSKTARTPGADQKTIRPLKARCGRCELSAFSDKAAKAASRDSNRKYNGSVTVTSKKLEWRATPKVGSLDNAAHKPGGGDKKIISQKVDFKAQSKVGSLDNVDHKPTGGAVKVETQKLDFKDKAAPKVGSLDNVKHKAGGGDVKILSEKLDFKERAASKIGSLPASDTGSTRGSESQSPTNLMSPQPQHSLEEVTAANGHDDSDVSPTKEETSAVPPGNASVLAAPEVAQC